MKRTLFISPYWHWRVKNPLLILRLNHKLLPKVPTKVSWFGVFLLFESDQTYQVCMQGRIPACTKQSRRQQQL